MKSNSLHRRRSLGVESDRMNLCSALREESCSTEADPGSSAGDNGYVAFQ